LCIFQIYQALRIMTGNAVAENYSKRQCYFSGTLDLTLEFFQESDRIFKSITNFD